jgi:hypothetical protein
LRSEQERPFATPNIQETAIHGAATLLSRRHDPQPTSHTVSIRESMATAVVGRAIIRLKVFRLRHGMAKPARFTSDDGKMLSRLRVEHASVAHLERTPAGMATGRHHDSKE